MPSTNTRSAGIALGSTVFAVGVLAELGFELVLRSAAPSALGPVAGRLLADATATALLGLGTLGAVFLVSGRTSIRSLSTATVGGVALVSGVLGRYVGTTVWFVFRDTGVPSPVVLVTDAQLSVGGSDLGLLVAVLAGLVAAGLWPLVGTFGGIGLASMSSPPS